MRYPLENIYITYPYHAPADWFPTGLHEGVDLRASVHTPVYAIARGRVGRASLYEEDGSPYGTHIRILHNNNSFYTLSGHLDELAVKAKDFVEEGQIIGYTGNTGNSTGPHLHFEVRVNGKWVDPMQFIKSNNLNNRMIENGVKKNQQYLKDIAEGNVAYFMDVEAGIPFRVKNSKRKDYKSPQEMWMDNMCLGVKSDDANKLDLE